MVGAVSGLVAPGGTLAAIQGVLDPDEDGSGPPWPLTREEIGSFAANGLREVEVEQGRGPSGHLTWRAIFER